MKILGLGTNLGDRASQLQQAVDRLRPVLRGMRCSPVYESAALLPKDAPADWNIPFLNMAVCGESSLEPVALLAHIKIIEKDLGRQPRSHWGPREIDIDILADGERSLVTAELIIPHTHLLQRDFALLPLADLVPDWRYPLHGKHYGKTARELSGLVPCAARKTEIVIT